MILDESKAYTLFGSVYRFGLSSMWRQVNGDWLWTEDEFQLFANNGQVKEVEEPKSLQLKIQHIIGLAWQGKTPNESDFVYHNRRSGAISEAAIKILECFEEHTKQHDNQH